MDCCCVFINLNCYMLAFAHFLDLSRFQSFLVAAFEIYAMLFDIVIYNDYHCDDDDDDDKDSNDDDDTNRCYGRFCDLVIKPRLHLLHC